MVVYNMMLMALVSFVWRGMLVYWAVLAFVMHRSKRHA